MADQKSLKFALDIYAWTSLKLYKTADLHVAS